jgi:hypothetical protein
LWIFGIVITLFGQGEYSFSVNYRESYPAGQGGLPAMPGKDLLINILDNPIPYIIGFGLLSLVFWFIRSLICWWSQSALISMVDDVDQKGSTSVASGWNAGKRRAVPLAVVSIIFSLPTTILALPAIAGGAWMFSQFFDTYKAMLLGEIPSPEEMQVIFQPLMSSVPVILACIFPLICIGGILGWLLGLLNKIAARSFVLEDRTIIDSIKRGWQITRKNIGMVLLNGIVLAVISFIFGWVAAIPALIIWVPVARAFLHQSWTASTIIAAILVGFYFIFVLLGVGGILTSFNSTLWTKLYKNMVVNDSIVIADTQPS